jgi:hypothetical protein
MRSQAAVSLFVVLAPVSACSSTREPVAPAPTAAPPADPAPGPAPPACTTKEACLEAARAADHGGDADKAKALSGRACDLGSGAGCLLLALAIRGNPPKVLAVAEKGCALGESRACVLVGDAYVDQKRVAEATDAYAKACSIQDDVGPKAKGLMCAAAARGSYQLERLTRAMTLAQKACDGDATAGCDIAGVMYANGESVPKDTAKAGALFAKGCAAGDKEACDHQTALAALLDPVAVEGANLTVAEITADGFKLTNMACKLAGGGLEALAAGPVLAAVLGKKKGALDACAPAGADVSVRWTIAGRRVADVTAKAGDDKKIEACVERVVRSSTATFQATCRASFHIGKR